MGEVVYISIYTLHMGFSVLQVTYIYIMYLNPCTASHFECVA